MRYLKNILLFSFLVSFVFSLKAQEFISFSDTNLSLKQFVTNDNEWVIITKNNRAFYYGSKGNKEISTLDDFDWKYTLSSSKFNNKVWFDKENIYFQNADNIERVSKKSGSLIDELPFKDINNAPYSDGRNVFLITDYKGVYSQICYNTKKKKVVWATPTKKDFYTPIYTERFIITRDETGFPITLSYDKGKPMYPEIYEGGCPFNSWIDMFNLNNNDLSDSLFYYNGYVYAVNFYFGFLRKYEPNNYPVPLVSVDMNKFTRKESFSYSKTPTGNLFYTYQGIQFVSEYELDSLHKTQRKGSMGTYRLSIPFSKPHYYKIKSTTKMGDFKDFQSSNFIAFLEDRYIVFEQNSQMIGVSPIGARTYNFPKLMYPIDNYILFDDVLIYSSENLPSLIKMKIERVWTQEEIDALQPSPEIIQMIEEQQKNSKNSNSK